MISGIDIIRKKVSFFSDYILLVFFIVQLILNLLCAFLQELNINNQPYYHVNCIITQMLFSYYFIKTLQNRKIVFGGSILFLTGYFILTLYVQPFSLFPSYAYGLGCGVIAAYALLLLTNIINNLSATNILETKEFWIMAGILTYFGSSFFIFISYEYISGLLKGKASILWQFHNIFLSFGCLLFLKAIKSKKWILK